MRLRFGREAFPADLDGVVAEAVGTDHLVAGVPESTPAKEGWGGAEPLEIVDGAPCVAYKVRPPATIENGPPYGSTLAIHATPSPYENTKGCRAMNDTIRVRDHIQTCVHGSRWPHVINAARARWWREPHCPGGRELTLRRLPVDQDGSAEPEVVLPDGVWVEVTAL